MSCSDTTNPENADIILGPGDGAPTTDRQLLGPQDEDGNEGGPVNLTGATVVLKYQRRDRTQAAVSVSAAIVGDPTLGNVSVDWGPVTPKPTPGLEYDARFVATLAGGRQMTFPNVGFLWMHVSADFPAP